MQPIVQQWSVADNVEQNLTGARGMSGLSLKLKTNVNRE